MCNKSFRVYFQGYGWPGAAVEGGGATCYTNHVDDSFLSHARAPLIGSWALGEGNSSVFILLYRKTEVSIRVDFRRQFSHKHEGLDMEFNMVLWHGIKGDQSPLPAPKRSAFLKVSGKKDD